ncbi:MAG: glycosyltransferase family 2 protein [Chloroflexota bacterium]|jgi:GT2 family glycosyltransferase
MSTKVSVIIPNWNGCHHLDTCLSSLEEQTYADHEVILVDNASSDDSVAFVRQNFPEVSVISLNENRGFTGACNAGFASAEGEYIVLLNNDTETDAGWLAAIVDAFATHAEAGSIASKILLFDRRDHFHTAGDYYRLDGIPGNRGVWQRDCGQYDRPEYVFSACGAAAAYRRAMLEQIGFLDERFYFSCEDVDLGWRAHLAGWRVLYVPAAVVYHKLKATGSDVTASYYDGRNYLYLIWKNYPGSLLRRHWRSILAAQLRISWQALRSWRGAAARARLRGQLAGLVGFFTFRSTRRRIQRDRRLPDDRLTELMTSVDGTP